MAVKETLIYKTNNLELDWIPANEQKFLKLHKIEEQIVNDYLLADDIYYMINIMYNDKKEYKFLKLVNVYKNEVIYSNYVNNEAVIQLRTIIDNYRTSNNVIKTEEIDYNYEFS